MNLRVPLLTSIVADLTRIAGPCRVGTGKSSLILSEEGNSACLSSCSGGLRPLVELCVELAGFSGRCTGVSVPFRVVPSPTGLPAKRCLCIGFLPRADWEIGVVWHVAPTTWLVSNFPVRPASSGGAPGRAGTPSRQRRGIDSPVAIRRGEGAQIKWCRDPRCSPRGNPACRGTVGGSQEGCQVPFRASGWNLGLPWRRRSGQGPPLAKTLEPHGFSRVAAGFSSYDGDFRLPLVLALGSPIVHSSCEGRLGVALESLQGQRDLI